ncbi:MAG: dihydropteroate synthase [Woeseiaceae bacterium]
MFETTNRDRTSFDPASLGKGCAAIMGVLNVTPDSFSDGGQFITPDLAAEHAAKMVAMGADIIDIGGESTRPGADAVSETEELDRVIPVVERIVGQNLAPVSVDTSKPAVMREAVRVGAAMINDVRALQSDDALEAVADLAVPVCLMHMQGQPKNMQDSPNYRDVVSDVVGFLKSRVAACLSVGISPERIVLDPGFGFGKRLGDNLALLNALPELVAMGYPVLAGLSRKSMIGEMTGQPAHRRLIGSVVLALKAAEHGAAIVRVHDVSETREALAILQAIREQEKTEIGESS